MWLDALCDRLYTRRLRKSARPPGGALPPAVACWDCGLRHPLPVGLRQALASAEDFFARHAGHQVNWAERPGLAGLWQPNADIKVAHQALQTMTVTNLHSLANSATAGWQSAVVDNSANLYLDALVQVKIDFANTLPANSKAVFIYAYAGLESGVYSYPCTGSEGTLTLSDITANPTAVRRIGTVPYLVQDAVIPSSPFSVATGLGMVLPELWGLAIINQSGAAFAASGSTVKFYGTFLTSI